MSTPPFAPLPNRDASPVIRGFFYQIELTISRWLDLDQSTVLELERGEDIDIVGQTLTNRTLEQVKFRSRSVSLRSPEILEALVRFFLSFKANPGLDLCFRYLTNAEPAIERGMNFGRKAGGLQVWAEYSAGRLGTTESPVFFETLRTLLRQAIRPSSIRLEDWNSFRALLEEGNIELYPLSEG
jgi:hypothetical protein